MFTIDELLKSTRGTLYGRYAGPALAGICTDSRLIRPPDAFLAIRGKNFDGADFIPAVFSAGVCVAIVEKRSLACVLRAARVKGTSSRAVIAVDDAAAALGDIARHHRCKFDIPVIAVTGSNGKTTTKEMIAWVLAGSYKVRATQGTKNNHIGVPMTLLALEPGDEAAVIEMGSNHPGEIAYLAGLARPNIGVITNIGPAHLEFFKDLDGVMKEKWSLAAAMADPAVMVLNADDDFLRKQLAVRTAGTWNVGFGLKRTADFSGKIRADRRGEFIFGVNAARNFTLKTRGRMNVYNALAAAAVARLMGMDYADIRARLARFVFPPNRLDIREERGVRFINDAYNANPASLKQALEVLASFTEASRRIFVMGDMMELGAKKEDFHRAAAPDIAKSCDCLVTVGRLSRAAARSARDLGFNDKNIFTCATAEQAHEILRKKIAVTRDDVVLLKGSRAMKLEEIVGK